MFMYSIAFMGTQSLISIHYNSHTYEHQLKIKKHISLKILNSLCQRLNNLGDFT